MQFFQYSGNVTFSQVIILGAVFGSVAVSGLSSRAAPCKAQYNNLICYFKSMGYHGYAPSIKGRARCLLSVSGSRWRFFSALACKWERSSLMLPVYVLIRLSGSYIFPVISMIFFKKSALLQCFQKKQSNTESTAGRLWQRFCG